MVLVQHEGIKADFFGIAVFVQKKVVVIGGLFAVKARVGQGKETPVLQHLVFVDPAIRPLGKIAKQHTRLSFFVRVLQGTVLEVWGTEKTALPGA